MQPISTRSNAGRSPQTPQNVDVVIVGGGPRAIATLDRLAFRATAAGLPAVQVAIIDAIELGAGATWRTDQTAQFLNNTPASATTIYPDHSTALDPLPALPSDHSGVALVPGVHSLDPLIEQTGSYGPTFVEWAAAVADRGVHELPWVVAEAKAVRPWSFPTRRLQGAYYRDQLRSIAQRGGVQLLEVLGNVVDISAQQPAADYGDAYHDANADARTVALASGQSFVARTVILAQGMVQAHLTAEEQHFVDAAGASTASYIAPGMPAEQPWHAVAAGAPVIMRGLGANFYDVVAELTAGRGGTFFEVPNNEHGRLQYQPTGREPDIWATSFRGVPYRAKGDYGSYHPPKYEPQLANQAWVAQALAATPESLDFAADLWPTIAAEFALAWSLAQARREKQLGESTDVMKSSELRQIISNAAERDQAAARAREHDAQPWLVPHIDAALEELSESWGQQFTVAELRDPAAGMRRFKQQLSTEYQIGDEQKLSSAQKLIGVKKKGSALNLSSDAELWQQLVREFVDIELDSLSNPLTSPRQAVNRAMAVIRGSVARISSAGMLTGISKVRDLQGWWNSDSLFLASGAPAQRVRELLALVEAGVVHLIGPEPQVCFDTVTGEFVARSPRTSVTVRAKILAEARMSKGKVPRTRDPLLSTLLSRGDARVHRLGTDQVETGTVVTGAVETDSLEAVPPTAESYPLSLVNAAGVPDPRVLVLGIPAQSTQPGSSIGAAPGVPSPLLAGADIAARIAIEQYSTHVAGRSLV